MGLFLLLVGLSLFGLVMIYSSSAVLGMQRFSDPLFFVKKQAIFLAIGWGLYFAISQLPIEKLLDFRLSLLFLCVLGLVLVLIPGVGSAAGGAQRWVQLGPLSFQPAELVRLLFVFYLAAGLWIKRESLSSFNRGFLPFFVATSLLMFLLILQPDFGGAMALFAISVSMWFVGGVPLLYLGGLALLASPALLFVLFQASYRTQRVMTFLNPWSDPQGAGFQVIQSYLAFFEGKWTGVGLGNSQQKLFYLPEAHTDFVFSVIGEELGALGAMSVLSAFFLLMLFGFRIARQQQEGRLYFLGIGLSIFICLPALLNMMVTIGLLPTKGLPLPFFSAGGSSLIVSMMALGALQALHRKRLRI